MPDLQPPPDSSSPAILKRPFLLSGIIALAIAAYVGFTFFARWNSNRSIEKRDAVKAEEQRRANDQAAIQQLGGSQLAIRALYVSPAIIHPGETSQLCYDVDNAKTVTLNPPAGEVWPSHTRCLDLSPKKTTTYTLTITGADGQSTSQSVELKVEERQPIHIKSFPSQ